MTQSFDDGVATVVVKAFSPGAIYADAYCIEKMIAKNGTTFVYEATEVAAERPVILKILRRAPGNEDSVRERFKREGAILNTLEHPAVVRLFNLGVANDGTCFMAMERLAGETLGARLRREKKLSLPEVLRIFTPAADAIDAAHARGIVHRDLKPENLFLLDSGPTPLKVLDFGLSSLVGDGTLTRTGDSIGTPKYMAPEQIMSAKSAGPTVDVYALALCIFESLAGVSPFGEIDRATLLGAILHGRIQSLGSVEPRLAHISSILTKAMSVKAEERYASPSALMMALRVASEAGDSPVAALPLDHIAFKAPARLSEPGVSAALEVPRFSIPSAAPRPLPKHALAAAPNAAPTARRSRWLLWTTLLVLAAVAGAYVWMTRR